MRHVQGCILHPWTSCELYWLYCCKLYWLYHDYTDYTLIYGLYALYLSNIFHMTWSRKLYWLYIDYTNDTLIILIICIILLKHIPYNMKLQIILIIHWLYKWYFAYLYQCVLFCADASLDTQNMTHHVIYFKHAFAIIQIICIVLIFLLLFLCRWFETVKMAPWMAGRCWMLMFGRWNGFMRCKEGLWYGADMMFCMQQREWSDYTDYKCNTDYTDHTNVISIISISKG